MPMMNCRAVSLATRGIVALFLVSAQVRSFILPHTASFGQKCAQKTSSGTSVSRTLQRGKDDDTNTSGDDSQTIPFVIDRIGSCAGQVFQDISVLCVDVFFNAEAVGADSNKKQNIRPWKSLQLAYLRNAQYADLRSRARSQAQNDMFVARRVVSVPPSATPTGALILDKGSIYNTNDRAARGDFVRGEILGFCEVSERSFGLAKDHEGVSNESVYKGNVGQLRPIISNLAVRRDARNSGMGSKLVEACEEAVLAWDPCYNDIVLQVEEDNPSALSFYEKRGYQNLFQDPACRRYDTSGFLLKQVRTTKICMRKVLALQRAQKADQRVNKSLGLSFIGRLRDAVLVQDRS